MPEGGGGGTTGRGGDFEDPLEYIPLTNRVRGQYRKLRTEFFSSSIYGPSVKCAGHKLKGKNEDP